MARNRLANPGLAVDAADWVATTTTGAGSAVRVTVGGMDRPHSYRYTQTAVGEARIVTPAAPVTPGLSYSGTVQLRFSVVPSLFARVSLWFYNASGGIIAVTNVDAAASANTALRVTQTSTAPADAVTCRMRVGFATSNVTGPTVLDVSAARIEQTSDSPLAYADGDTSGWLWDGTTGASTSRTTDEIPPGTVTPWAADYTQATNVAAGYVNSGSQRQNGAGTFNDTTVPWPVTIQTAPGGRPGRAIPFTIPDNYRRYEQVPAHQEFAPGDVAYFGWSFYLEPSFPLETAIDYQVIEQIHQAWGSWSPPVAFEAMNNALYLTGGNGLIRSVDANAPLNTWAHFQKLQDIQVGRWYNVVYLVDAFSASPNTSKLSVWVDGVQLLDEYVLPCPTIVQGDAATNLSYRKQGFYHRETIHGGTIWHAGAKLATTYAEADPTPPASLDVVGAASSIESARPVTRKHVRPVGVAATELDSSSPVGQLRGGALVATLVDTFESGALDPQWTPAGGDVTPTGRLSITCAHTGGTPTYTNVRSTMGYAWSGSSLLFEVARMPAVAGVDTAFAQMWMMDPSPTATVDRLGFEYRAAANALDLIGQTGAGYAPIGTTTTLTYSATTHRWMRITHTGTSIVWATSPDGLTWTTQRTLATPPAWTSKTTLKVSFEAYRSTGVNDTFEVDSVNLPPLRIVPARRVLSAVGRSYSF